MLGFIKRIDFKRVALLLACPLFWVSAITVGVQSCNGNKAKANQQPSEPLTAQQQLDSTVVHHWDGFDFNDTTQLTTTIAEQRLADYLALLPHTSPGTGKASVSTLIGQATGNQTVYDWFAEQLDRYLYDPNSPYRNEELYAVVLEEIMASPVDDVYKIRPRSQLEDINRNRPGTIAADVTYTLASGRAGRLHEIETDYTLIFFYNPDCGECKAVKLYLQASPALTRLQESGRLQVLALYPDSDLKAWKTYGDQLPAGWLNGHDAAQAVNDKRVYALRAIPTLYLLGRDKTVLLKDCTPEQLETVLQTL